MQNPNKKREEKEKQEAAVTATSELSGLYKNKEEEMGRQQNMKEKRKEWVAKPKQPQKNHKRGGNT
jgi:hypothetical protein